VSVTTRWPLLEGLGPEDRQRVLDRLRRRRYGAGEVVFHEGDPADTIHFVVQGRVIARRSSVDGSRLAYGVLGPGEAFGEIGLLTAERRRSTTIEAVEPTVTMSLSYADFDRLRAKHPGVEALLVRLLAARVGRLTDGLLEALHVPADRRVARRILDLAGAYGTAGTGEATVLLTQSDLAELSGVTRPTANRVLRRLEAAGAVALRRGALVVLDTGPLRRAAGPEYRPAVPRD
jgi:CRP-like cAMP-binding protein